MLGGGLQVGALCYKGTPGQVFYTEYLGNTLIDSDGPVQSRIRVPLFAARTLNATGQSRATPSLR